MNFSIPTLLVAAYAVYCEGNIQKTIKAYKNGEIHYLKLIDIKFRIFVYFMNTGIALYNYLTGFDDYLMAGLLILSMHMVANVSKIIVEDNRITIGNTKIKPEDFTLVELKPLDEKNAKFTFAMVVRGRRLEKKLYLPIHQVEPLRKALMVFKPSKKESMGKNKKN